MALLAASILERHRREQAKQKAAAEEFASGIAAAVQTVVLVASAEFWLQLAAGADTCVHCLPVAAEQLGSDSRTAESELLATTESWHAVGPLATEVSWHAGDLLDVGFGR